MEYRGRVFIVDDDQLINKTLSRALGKEGYEIRSVFDADNLPSKIKSWSPDVVLMDVSLPGMSGIDALRELRKQEIDCEVVMLTADDTAETAVKAMKLGALDYLTKPFSIEEVRLVVKNAYEKNNLSHEVEHLRKVSQDLTVKEIIGTSHQIAELKDKISRMAEAEVKNVLITGESGTGKEVLARHFHRLMCGNHSTRYSPFIGINCTALTETLIESELFGYEKGAFTDAKSDRKGLFEEARGGVLLLDEIGDMKIDLQSKLLRVLEERTVRRIGGEEERPIDVTVIVTTNQVLKDRVDTAEFRADLFYRLNTFAFHVPPLRERKEDIPLLADHFLRHFAVRYNNRYIKGLSRRATDLLVEYSWPGNVRELRNVIERVVVLEVTQSVLPEHLPKEIVQPGPECRVSAGMNSWFDLPEGGICLDTLQKNLIIQALEKTRNKKGKAAGLLGITYDALRYQMKKYELE